ncbi:MAG TPA: hypothetical protein VIL35_12535 [Vicinamibacterales bacterium]
MRGSRTLFLACVALLGALLDTGCAPAASREIRLVPMPATGPPVGRIPREDYEAALGAIGDVFEREIGLPRPQVSLVLFPDRKAFEDGLRAVGYSPSFARQTARNFHAIGGAKAVLVNEGSLRQAPWEDRILVLAHELVHSAQYALGGGVRGASEQWLREGFAELVAMEVADRLGIRRYADLREALLGPLVSVRPDARPAPLARLSTFQEWAAAQGRYEVPLYPQAFAATELLVERHGREAVIRYFTLFRTSQDRHANFAAAFGTRLEDVDRELGQRWPRLRALGR